MVSCCDTFHAVLRTASGMPKRLAKTLYECQDLVSFLSVTNGCSCSLVQVWNSPTTRMSMYVLNA